MSNGKMMLMIFFSIKLLNLSLMADPHFYEDNLLPNYIQCKKIIFSYLLIDCETLRVKNLIDLLMVYNFAEE